LPAQREIPSIVTRPVITSMAQAIRLHWRTVVAVTWGWRHWNSATISTIGALRCGLRVVVSHHATLHDNGPPHLIFGEGIDRYGFSLMTHSQSHGFLEKLGYVGLYSINPINASRGLMGTLFNVLMV